MSGHEYEQDDDRDEDEAMTEEDMEQHLIHVLEYYAEEEGEPEPRARTYKRAGILTLDHGVVVEIDGAEFQLTIQRTK